MPFPPRKGLMAGLALPSPGAPNHSTAPPGMILPSARACHGNGVRNNLSAPACLPPPPPLPPPPELGPRPPSTGRRSSLALRCASAPRLLQATRKGAQAGPPPLTRGPWVASPARCNTDDSQTRSGAPDPRELSSPQTAHPLRCLLSIRFFCRTGCSGMLSVMAAAAGAEQGGMRFPSCASQQRLGSARPGPPPPGSAAEGAGLGAAGLPARRCRSCPTRPGALRPPGPVRFSSADPVRSALLRLLAAECPARFRSGLPSPAQPCCHLLLGLQAPARTSMPHVGRRDRSCQTASVRCPPLASSCPFPGSVVEALHCRSGSVDLLHPPPPQL